VEKKKKKKRKAKKKLKFNFFFLKKKKVFPFFINSMEKPGKKTVEELRQALEELGLDSRGRKPELKLRLKKAQKKQASETPKEEEEEEEKKEIRQQEFDYFLFFDVEATCIKDGGFNYANEIIEFPIVLVDGTTFDIVDEFRSYVKPGINPILSEFCIELTGITQETVDQSPDFVQVLNEFQVFMAKYDLFRSKTATFVTGKKRIHYNTMIC
jgi:3'-5' exoribonuclease 1